MKIKIILSALLLTFANIPFAHALTWSFAQNNNFDQIIISNNLNKEKIETIRTDTNKILIQGKNFDKNLQLVKGNLITDVIPTEYGLTVLLNDNAFGFIQNTDKDTLIIGIYKDPLGARWKPTEQRIEFNNQVSEKEETVKAKLEELKAEQKIPRIMLPPFKKKKQRKIRQPLPAFLRQYHLIKQQIQRKRNILRKNNLLSPNICLWRKQAQKRLQIRQVNPNLLKPKSCRQTNTLPSLLPLPYRIN